MTARKKWILGAATVVLLVLAAGGAVFALTRPPHVNIDEIVVKALAQSSGARIVRREQPS